VVPIVGVTGDRGRAAKGWGVREFEYFTTGTPIVTDGQDVLDHFWIVRSGSVEVLDRGRVVDQLGPGATR